MKNLIFLLLLLFTIDAKSQCGNCPQQRRVITRSYVQGWATVNYFQHSRVRSIRYYEPPPQPKIVYIQNVVEKPAQIIYREKIVYVEKRVKEPSSHTITVSEKNGPTLISVTVLD